MKLRILLKNLFLIIPLLFVLSCGEEQSSTGVQNNSNVPIQIIINTPESENQSNQNLKTAQIEECIEFVDTVSVTIEGDFPTISQQFGLGEDIVVFVPPGPVVITIALLNNGQACCSGQTSLTIVPNVVNEVTIDCEKVDEICNDGFDNNGNEQTDCEEDDCAGSQCDETNFNLCIDGECVPPIPEQEDDCNDDVDNDQDGDTDCDDTDCFSDEACVELICDDETDNDNDGDIDCEDVDCGPDPVCDEVCDDGIDNDVDGNADCLDDECDNQNCDPENEDFVCIDNECTTEGEVDCDNGVDDDGDQFVDCDDLDDCEGRICFEGNSGSACVIVDTGEGLIGECQEVACNDNVNNDGDTLFQEPATDCVDQDCEGEACGTGSGAECDFFGEGGECIEVNCFDQNDNDLDESTDCDDAFDCGFSNSPCGTGSGGAGANCEQTSGQTFTFECQENACTNGQDDDRDGLTDCDDPDCYQDAACPDCSMNCGEQNNDCIGRQCQGPGTSCDVIEGLECGESDCDDNIDNDGNQSTDCEDFFFCNGEPGGPQGQLCETSAETTCDDNFDNDRDGLTDCQDGLGFSNCDGATGPMGQTCEPNGEVSCQDGFDNDGDTLVDGNDPDCQL